MYSMSTSEVTQVVVDRNDAEFLALLVTNYMAQSNKTEHLVQLRDKLWGVQK